MKLGTFKKIFSKRSGNTPDLTRHNNEKTVRRYNKEEALIQLDDHENNHWDDYHTTDSERSCWDCHEYPCIRCRLKVLDPSWAKEEILYNPTTYGWSWEDDQPVLTYKINSSYYTIKDLETFCRLLEEDHIDVSYMLHPDAGIRELAKDKYKREKE